VLDVIALVAEYPNPDGKIKALENDLIPGGSSLNAAVVFANLGGEATLASSLGASGLSRNFVLAELNKYSVDLHDICDDPYYHLPLSTVVSTSGLGTRMIINDSQDDCDIFRDCRELFSGKFDLLQLDQYERYFVEQHFSEIGDLDCPIVLDGGSWKEWSPDFLRLVDIPIVSEAFLSDGFESFIEMCANLGLSRWAITRGSEGVIWRDGDKTGEIPAVSIEAVDTLGAGDIFHGAFCHAFAETGMFVEALNSANQIAAKSCESMGTRSWMNA
jgi:sugar/nucleoside kinase (ribokinase family)